MYRKLKSGGLDFISSDFLYQNAVRAFIRSRVDIFRYRFLSSKFSGVRSFANWLAYFLLFLYSWNIHLFHEPVSSSWEHIHLQYYQKDFSSSHKYHLNHQRIHQHAMTCRRGNSTLSTIGNSNCTISWLARLRGLDMLILFKYYVRQVFHVNLHSQNNKQLIYS